jgi:ribosome-binding factor A
MRHSHVLYGRHGDIFVNASKHTLSAYKLEAAKAILSVMKGRNKVDYRLPHFTIADDDNVSKSEKISKLTDRSGMIA